MMQKKVIGIDVGATHISGGVVANAKVLSTEVVGISKVRTKKEFFSKLFGVIDSLIDNSIKSIGIGFPAPVVKGAVFEAQNMPFMAKTNIKKIVWQRYRLKCAVDNDANAFALAETKFGAAKGRKNVVGITLGTGLGCGIIINGKIYSGNTGAAGEISRIPANHHNLEHFTSSKFFKSLGKDPKKLEELARNGNKSALKVYEEFGRDVGVALAIVVDAYDPEMIVLGGKISKAYPVFKKYLMPEIRKHTFRHAASKVKIVRAKLENAGIIGAALACY